MAARADMVGATHKQDMVLLVAMEGVVGLVVVGEDEEDIKGNLLARRSDKILTGIL